MLKTILLDLDGTVYKGNNMILGADDAINNMRDQGLTVLFCTNNSSILADGISNKLKKMGIMCEKKDIISSGQLALTYSKHQPTENIYVSGSDELIAGFKNAGLCQSEPKKTDTLIIGMDSKFTYEKMAQGVRAAISAKKIILCNEDRIFLKEDGAYPGCGGMTASILYCAHKKPNIILGKPNTYMAEYASRITRSSKNEMMVVGDSIDSDIKMAKKFGCDYLLVDQKKGKKTIKSLADTVDWDWTSFNHQL